jgi:hypothetical protein
MLEYEEDFPGGLTSLGERVDILVKTIEPCKKNPKGDVELSIVTGSSNYSLVDVDPKQLRELGSWLSSIAADIIARRDE